MLKRSPSQAMDTLEGLIQNASYCEVMIRQRLLCNSKKKKKKKMHEHFDSSFVLTSRRKLGPWMMAVQITSYVSFKPALFISLGRTNREPSLSG
jgi:hypothetical protein